MMLEGKEMRFALEEKTGVRRDASSQVIDQPSKGRSLPRIVDREEASLPQEQLLNKLERDCSCGAATAPRVWIGGTGPNDTNNPPEITSRRAKQSSCVLRPCLIA